MTEQEYQDGYNKFLEQCLEWCNCCQWCQDVPCADVQAGGICFGRCDCEDDWYDDEYDDEY